MPPGRSVLLLPLLALLGCAESVPPAAKAPVLAVPGPSQFDAATTGMVTGQVLWQGDLPKVPPFEVSAFVPPDQTGKPRVLRDNPNAPRIDPKTPQALPRTYAIADVVVYLKGVDPLKACPWSHEPVRVEQSDQRLLIYQGDNTTSHVGFARRGDSLELVSRDPKTQALRATGAAFFTLTFPDPGQPRRRTLTEKGLVELSSASSHYWMRAYVFVDDQPYFTRTDKDGRFRLNNVPAGDYQVVCWLPNWKEKERDRDPESSLPVRLRFQPPLEQSQALTIRANIESRVEFLLNSK